MEELEEIPFIVKLRSAGKGKSLIVTIPKEVCEIIHLQDGDYVKMTVKKIRLEKT
jgi:antitoxin component of MazEF toxin-antitoxin module